MSVYAPLLGHLWRTLEAYGIDPCLAIHARHFRLGGAAPDVERVSFEEYDEALARAATLITDPAVGIRSAQFMHPSHLGALGYAWLASSSLRSALRMGSRFHRMYNENIDLQLQELPDRVCATYRMLRQPVRPDLIADSLLANLMTLCRLNFGQDLKPLKVNLRRPRPQDPEPWLQCFGITPNFEQADNSLLIAARDADKPLSGSNPELVAIHEEVMKRHLLKLDRKNILNRARLGIMDLLPSGSASGNDVAHALHMSERTLHRKLRENNETFRSLLLQVRKDLAERYINNRDYSITEIAFLLGYNDTSAFSRAFRGWFGRSPTQLRDLRGTPGSR